VEEDAEIVDNSRRNAADSQRSAQDGQRNARIRELENEVERFRRASEDALQQLDWCIGYLHGSGKKAVARAISKNREYIRTNLLKRSEQPVPSQETNES
jgi:hypothetical protein